MNKNTNRKNSRALYAIAVVLVFVAVAATIAAQSLKQPRENQILITSEPSGASIFFRDVPPGHTEEERKAYESLLDKFEQDAHAGKVRFVTPYLFTLDTSYNNDLTIGVAKAGYETERRTIKYSGEARSEAFVLRAKEGEAAPPTPMSEPAAVAAASAPAPVQHVEKTYRFGPERRSNAAPVAAMATQTNQQGVRLRRNQILIESEPSGVTVNFRNQTIGVTPFVWTVPRDIAPKRGHRTRIELGMSKEGYKHSEGFIFYDGSSQTRSFSLEKNEIIITSNVIGATVTIDNKYVGITPYTWTNPYLGDMIIKVSKDGYANVANNTKSINYKGGIVKESFSMITVEEDQRQKEELERKIQELANKAEISSRSLDMIGSRNRNHIIEVFMENEGEILNAYLKQLLSNPNLYGTLTVTFNIDESGKVTGTDTESNMKSNALEIEVAAIIRGLNFGPHNNRPYTTKVTVGFDFVPNKREIVITSEPSGANVIIRDIGRINRLGQREGQRRLATGKTPFSWAPPMSLRGEFEIQVSKDGYRQEIRDIQYKDGSETYSFTLGSVAICPGKARGCGVSVSYNSDMRFHMCRRCGGRENEIDKRAREEQNRREAERKRQAHHRRWAAAKAQCVGNGGRWCDPIGDGLEASAKGVSNMSNMDLIHGIIGNLSEDMRGLSPNVEPRCSYNGRCD